MVPHSYAVDSLSKSQDLASTILSASSPPQISAACSSIASLLRSHSADHSRHFFSLAFPALISKLFGFVGLGDPAVSPQSPSSTGWIDTVTASNDSDLADRVYALLDPGGSLLGSIAAVDRLNLVRYVFPSERLPEWARLALSSEKDRKVVSELCPIFKNRVVEDSIKGSVSQIQLNVFEYYMFWFAYYPVCRANGESSDASVVKKNRRFKLENWVSSVSSGFSTATRQSHESTKPERNLYLRLLYSYLRAFVPTSDTNPNPNQPHRASLLHYSPSYDPEAATRGEFVVHTLVHFWLVESDFRPLPSGRSFPLRQAPGETPPAAGIAEAARLFVNYLNSGTSARGGGDESEGGDHRDGGSPCHVGSWNSAIQRPLYRFVLRTILYLPVGASMKNASEVFSLWIAYLEPWRVGGSEDGFSGLVGKSGRDCGYSPCWQGYVLSNYLYYSSLVTHFIGFAHKFLHADVETVVQMVSKAISIFTSSKELADLIRTMDSVYHSNQAGSRKPMRNNLYRYVPSIREQLKDWEEGLSETDADGSFMNENWNKDLRLFSDGEDGGQHLLQLFILRADAELQADSGGNLARNLQCIDSLKAQVSSLFGRDTIKRLSFSPEVKLLQQPRDDIFKPRRVGSRFSENTKYERDWMSRPISDDEVAWLAKYFVSLSNWLNLNLGLSQLENSQVGPTWSYVEVSNADVDNVCGVKDTTKAVLCALGSWFLMLGVNIVKLMRKHGMRVNLRILASKKVVMVVLLYVVFNILRRAFRLLS